MSKLTKYISGDFSKFLLEYKTLPTGAFTHTSLGNPMGSFYIPVEKEDEFYKLYSMAIKANEKLYLTEKHKLLSPLLLDFDFRYQIGDELKRLYTNEDILKIIQTYVSILSEYCETEDIKVYLFEKEHPTIISKKDTDDIAKDGIHIMIPDIVAKPSLQYIIRNRFIEKMGNYFSDLGFTNKIEDIYDECVIEKNNWFMYGSSKPKSQVYDVTQVYKINNGDISYFSNGCRNILENTKLFSIRNKYTANNIKFEKQIEINKYNQDILAEEQKKKILAQATHKYPQKMNKSQYDNIDLVRKFVTILSVERASQYDSWIRLGWCLRTIDERLLDSWVEFSRKSGKYTEGECEKLWDRMKDTGLGIGTLRMWAKQDNCKAYEDVISKDWTKFLEKAISKTEYDMAVVVYNMFKYDYVCSSIKHNMWYQFRNHRWEPIDSGYTLRNHISTDVVKQFYKMMGDISMKACNEEDPDEQDRLQEKAKKIMKIICELKTTAKKNNILKECAEMFYYEKFEDQLDSNVNLIGFKNGVYDLELLEFREGRPDDYISFSTNINHQDYDPENKVNEEVMEFVRKVMPKPHLLEYLMKCFASFLSGKNKEEKFHIWTGSGSNGEILNCHKGSSKVARLLIKVWSNILLKLSSRRIFVLLL
jgi:hypothetical protein